MLIRHDIAPENYLADETDYRAIFPLFNNGKMKEGVATLINSKWAVTAAHCAVDLYKKDFENHPFLVQIGIGSINRGSSYSSCQDNPKG